MKFDVKLTQKAEQDLLALFDFILQRELDRDGDIDIGRRAIEAIRSALRMLSLFPFTCRKATDSAFLRELVIPFGHSGYVVLFEIVDDRTVVVAAIRHQLEDDYH